MKRRDFIKRMGIITGGIIIGKNINVPEDIPKDSQDNTSIYEINLNENPARVIRTGLPEPAWRMLNEGIKINK